MIISYNWLSEYLPETVEAEKLGKILTALGLEVEHLEHYEGVKGSLAGLVIGQVVSCEKHPDADKLHITQVKTDAAELLQIVCGAPNVAVGQKVVVAPVGCTIHPHSGEPLTMKKAKIRGVESQGMICAEDEIGLGASHDGILVLPADAPVGTTATEYFKPYTDWIYEIGLTPNRMDAMSHLGVARDVCAWLNHHQQKSGGVKSPLRNTAWKTDAKTTSPVAVRIENPLACQRYTGVAITGIVVAESPQWLKDKLTAVGVRPINNVVDVTNFILHETGQPLHAFDMEKIGGGAIVVKNLANETPFVTLDGKVRTLHADDLMICDGNDAPMCLAGVFGGQHSGVSAATTQIFLESAWFDPITIRKTSFRHGLRTEAAARYEKGIDISNCAAVLKRAALMVKTLCGGEIVGELADVYPNPRPKTEISLKFHYLKKLSGKNYHPDTVKGILESLGFEFLKEGSNDFWFAVPYSKPDIALPADIVEEIMRVDGYDNVEIPQAIMMSPSADALQLTESWRQKISGHLCGAGFLEMLNNSITNSAYYSPEALQAAVKMLNNLSSELDVLRPSMLETGLQTIAHNLNRRNLDLLLFEFGRTYSQPTPGKYEERTHCCLFASGHWTLQSWNQKAKAADLFLMKGQVEQLLATMGIDGYKWQAWQTEGQNGLELLKNNTSLGTLGMPTAQKLQQFGIKQPVIVANLYWDSLMALLERRTIVFKGISKFPGVERDLAMVVEKSLTYDRVQQAAAAAKAQNLQSMELFDVFESEKLGAQKKSLAVHFTFLNEAKTLTDKEIDQAMQRLVTSFEQQLGAEIRK
ncbi:MAG: phenylalanine--tRNA ligase subunit beta [Bacteroidetes bacterium]|nr:MAG: phenylalanine--tRNA ligase subunit beta [Bacteroidota bacterium]